MGFYPNEGDVDSNGAEEVNLRTSAGAELLGQQASAASLPVVIASDQTVPISAASLPLPTGAATAALQTTGNTSLSSIDTKTPTLVSGRQPVDGSGVTQPISAVSLPLPTGAATAANQTTLGSQTTTINNGTTTLAINTDGSLNFRYPERLAVGNSTEFGFSIEQNQANTGEQDLILFRNPTGSGKTVYINKINVGEIDTITRFRIRVYQKPTITAVGTAGTTFSLQIKGSPATAAALVYTLPTISARGTRIRSYSQADTGSKWEDFQYGISLAEGFDMLITGDTDASNKVLFASFYWREE